MKKLVSNRGFLGASIVVALIAGVAIGGAFFARNGLGPRRWHRGRRGRHHSLEFDNRLELSVARLLTVRGEWRQLGWTRAGRGRGPRPE